MTRPYPRNRRYLPARPLSTAPATTRIAYTSTRAGKTVTAERPFEGLPRRPHPSPRRKQKRTHPPPAQPVSPPCHLPRLPRRAPPPRGPRRHHRRPARYRAQPRPVQPPLHRRRATLARRDWTLGEAEEKIGGEVRREIGLRLGFLNQVRPRLPHARPRKRHPLRRRGPAHPPRHPDRLQAHRHPLHPRRAQHRPPPARQ